MLRPFVASIMVSPPCLKKIRRRVFHLHFPIFTNMFVKSRAAAERRAFTQIALFFSAVYLTCSNIHIFFLQGKWRRDTNFYWQFKKFLPLAIYQWSNICRSLPRDCRLVFLFLLSPNYLDESASLNREVRKVHKKIAFTKLQYFTDTF